MRLYLVRHGDALPKDEDPQRHLSAAGEEQAHVMGEFLETAGTIRPTRILHSGKARAEQTAEILAEHLGTDEVSETDNLDPEDHPALWAEEIDSLDDDLMIVGHLPFMSRMAALLLLGDVDGEVVAFPKAAVCCLVRDAEGVWLLEWHLGPALLG